MTCTYIMVLNGSNWLFMLNFTMKLMVLAFLIAGIATGIKSDSAILVLGCGSSILFGFLLDIYHMLAKDSKISRKVIFYKFMVAISFSYGVFAFWMAYYGNISLWLIFCLFICSLMASAFTEILIGVSKVGFKNVIKTILEKLLSNMDNKEDRQP